MERAPQTTDKVGSVRGVAAWTRRVVCDPNAARGMPQTSFASGETAQRGVAQISAEAMVKLLSPGNLAVLAAIRQHKPGSMRELAALTGRKEASVSRTLKRFAQAGIVGFRDGPHRTRMPMLIARRVRLDIDLAGRSGGVAVTRRSAPS